MYNKSSFAKTDNYLQLKSILQFERGELQKILQWMGNGFAIFDELIFYRYINDCPHHCGAPTVSSSHHLTRVTRLCQVHFHIIFPTKDLICGSY